MKRLKIPFLRKFHKDERGQSAVVVTVMLFSIMALAASGVETGHVYYAYRLLQESTNAATLAAAQAMPDIGTSGSATAGTGWGNLVLYSSQSGEKNASNLLQSDSITASFYCSSTMQAAPFNIGCQAPPSGEGSCSSGSSCNAIKVTQTAKVNLWFGGLVGFRSMNLTATSAAAMRGGQDQPWNIAIILDTTKSMSDADSGAQCSGTQISCALAGVQDLLADLTPCPLNTTCTSTSSYVDDVSLFVFPPVLNSTAKNDYTCPTSTPTHEYYMVPTLNPSWTYQIVPFSHDYRTTDTAALNPSSALVVASGGGSCAGVQAEGGAGTYYAQVIYTAEAGLAAQQAANPGSKNAMIILSDGNATATTSYTGTGLLALFSSTSDLQPSVAGLLNGILGILGVNSPTYPSALGECGQAVVAAQAAANAGTSVYTIGYGSPTSGGCTSDKTYSASATTGGGSWAPGDQPCAAIAAMASSKSNFYSDDGAGCLATAPSNQSLTKLTQIFQAISSNFTNSRLIPPGTS